MKATWTTPAEVAAGYVANGFWTDDRAGRTLGWAAAEFPQRDAVVVGPRRVTYAELDRLVARAAAGLRALGVGAGDVVSFQLPNTLEAVITWHAIQRLSAIPNPITPIYRTREVEFALRQARTKVAVIPDRYRGHDYVEMYAEMATRLPSLAAVVVVGDAPAAVPFAPWRVVAEAAGAVETCMPGEPDDVALLLYTSGTTADPKGVLHTHQSLLYDARAMAAWYGLNDRDVIFNPAPVTHASGMLCALVIPPVIGATVVLQDRWDAAEAIELVEREHVSFMLFATPFLQDLADLQDTQRRDLSGIRYIVCGGADVPELLVHRATASLGPVVRMYGSSEVPSMTTCSRADGRDRRASTDGRWMRPTRAVLVADDGTRIAGAGRGEIRVTGPDVFGGYLDASLNAEAFDDAGAFCTGDVGERDADGYLRIVGRIKDIINRSGEKFSAREIEELLYAHPAVRDVAVVAVPDPKTVEKACAFVVAATATAPTLADLCDYLQQHDLSKRKLPERLVVVEELPRTASGKVQKHLLRTQASGS